MRSEQELRERLEFLTNIRDTSNWYGGIYLKEVWEKEIKVLEWALEPTADVLDEYYADEHYYDAPDPDGYGS